VFKIRQAALVLHTAAPAEGNKFRGVSTLAATAKKGKNPFGVTRADF
jgi:hypothetical protein